MNKWIIGTFFFFTSFSAYAQSTISCPQQTPSYYINLNEAPIRYDLSKFSRQLNSHNNSTTYTLGEHHARIEVKTSATLSTMSNSRSSCQYISRMDININFYPVIYIAQEAQRFTCTYQRIMRHEQQHYMIQKTALRNLMQNMKPFIQNFFTVHPVNYNNSFNLTAYHNQKSNELSDLIFKTLNQQTEPYDKQLDTPENYAQEAKQCSPTENQNLSRLLRGN